MNLPLFILHGLNNSIRAACVLLFAALWLELTTPSGDAQRRWLSIGALLCIAALMRQTFVPLVALGAFAVLVGHRIRPFSRVLDGGAGTGLRGRRGSHRHVGSRPWRQQDHQPVQAWILARRSTRISSSGQPSPAFTHRACPGSTNSPSGHEPARTGHGRSNRPWPYGVESLLPPIQEPKRTSWPSRFLAAKNAPYSASKQAGTQDGHACSTKPQSFPKASTTKCRASPKYFARRN